MSGERQVTYHQYEPLRAPAEWTSEERRFVARLTEIFDDIYRRYGRLGLSDMARSVREEITGTIANVQDISETLAANSLVSKGDTPPESPVEGALWLDASCIPPLLKRYDGENWLVVNNTDELTGVVETLLSRVTTAEMKLSDESFQTTVQETLTRQATVVDALADTVAGQAAALEGMAGREAVESLDAAAAALAAQVVELQSRVTQLAGSLTVEVSERVSAQTALESAQSALQTVQDALALYVRITTAGVEIGRPGDPVKMTADNAELSAASVEARDNLSIGSWRWQNRANGLAVVKVG